jgi:hypothetical protein
MDPYKYNGDCTYVPAFLPLLRALRGCNKDVTTNGDVTKNLVGCDVGVWTRRSSVAQAGGPSDVSETDFGRGAEVLKPPFTYNVAFTVQPSDVGTFSECARAVLGRVRWIWPPVNGSQLINIQSVIRSVGQSGIPVLMWKPSWSSLLDCGLFIEKYRLSGLGPGPAFGWGERGPCPGRWHRGGAERQLPTGHTLIRSTIALRFPHLQTKRVEQDFFLIWLYWL